MKTNKYQELIKRNPQGINSLAIANTLGQPKITTRTNLRRLIKDKKYKITRKKEQRSQDFRTVFYYYPQTWGGITNAKHLNAVKYGQMLKWAKHKKEYTRILALKIGKRLGINPDNFAKNKKYRIGLFATLSYLFESI